VKRDVVSQPDRSVRTRPPRSTDAVQYALIVIGVSAGGLHALGTLLEGLPSDFPVPIAVVQHRSRDSDALATVLQRHTQLEICEIEDKMPFLPGRVYVAPPDYHALIDGDHFALSVDAPVAYSRPSIDVLFESAADQLGPQVIGVVLTGANHDGAFGLRRISDRGGRTLVQDPASAEVPVMPRAALDRVPEARLGDLKAIAGYLVSLTKAAE
jgi:two-component system, chemotaxis family, protein-glutamate methylesterase/glutaminase